MRVIGGVQVGKVKEGETCARSRLGLRGSDNLKAAWSADRLERALEQVLSLARQRDDLAVCLRSVELIGKLRGLFKDSPDDFSAIRRFSAAEIRDADRLARLLLAGGGMSQVEIGAQAMSSAVPGDSGPIPMANSACAADAQVDGPTSAEG
jgi:hypothetical protein